MQFKSTQFFSSISTMADVLKGILLLEVAFVCFYGPYSVMRLASVLIVMTGKFLMAFFQVDQQCRSDCLFTREYRTRSCFLYA